MVSNKSCLHPCKNIRNHPRYEYAITVKMNSTPLPLKFKYMYIINLKYRLVSITSGWIFTIIPHTNPKHTIITVQAQANGVIIASWNHSLRWATQYSSRNLLLQCNFSLYRSVPNLTRIFICLLSSMST